MLSFFKKNASSIFLLIFILLLFIPQTGTPIRVFVNRLISMSPSEIDKDERAHLTDYHWNLQDLNGEKIDFKRSEGKVIVLNIWATWCPPCLAEMPSLHNLYKEFGHSVDFYFVSWEERQVLQHFLSKKDYILPVYQPLGEMPSILDSSSLPTTYLISQDGEIVIKKTGAASWDSESVVNLINDLLKQS